MELRMVCGSYRDHSITIVTNNYNLNQEIHVIRPFSYVFTIVRYQNSFVTNWKSNCTDIQHVPLIKCLQNMRRNLTAYLDNTRLTGLSLNFTQTFKTFKVGEMSYMNLPYASHSGHGGWTWPDRFQHSQCTDDITSTDDETRLPSKRQAQQSGSHESQQSELRNGVYKMTHWVVFSRIVAFKWQKINAISSIYPNRRRE